MLELDIDGFVALNIILLPADTVGVRILKFVDNKTHVLPLSNEYRQAFCVCVNLNVESSIASTQNSYQIIISQE